MTSGVAFQMADLKWLVPMIVGAVALIGCIVIFFKRPNQGWNLSVVAVLAAALIGASVFSQISLTKDGIIIETATASNQVLVGLQQAAKTNADTIAQVSARVDQLAAVTKQISDAQSAGSATSSALSQFSQDAQKIQDALKANSALLDTIGLNNAAIKAQLDKAKSLF
jgi:hypothetical protein